MIYMVLAFDDADFADPDWTQEKRENRVSKTVSWDSPVPVVEVKMRNLRHGLTEQQKERLGL